MWATIFGFCVNIFKANWRLILVLVLLAGTVFYGYKTYTDLQLEVARLNLKVLEQNTTIGILEGEVKTNKKLLEFSATQSEQQNITDKKIEEKTHEVKTIIRHIKTTEKVKLDENNSFTVNF